MKFIIGKWVVVLPLDHLALKNVMNSTTEITKGKDYRFFEKWLGPGLLLGDGERWHKTRKLVTPAFHFSKIEEYAETMDAHARTLVEILSAKANGEVVDLYNPLKLCALDIIADTTMGVQLQAQQKSDQPYVQAVEKFNYYACNTPADWVWKWFGYQKETDEAVEVLHAFTNNVIKERMKIFKDEQENRESSVKHRPNFLDLMLHLQDSEKLSKDHLREEVDTIMFAGHDTTSHYLSWFMWSMATHPEIQQRVYEEIVDHFGHSDAEFGTSRVKELKQIFEHPLKFDPSRFEGKEYPPLSFIPFSAGPRNCVGQRFATLEAKIVICHLLYNFKLETDLKLEDNPILFEVVLRPTRGVPVRLTKREH
ncbi:hypothetical protein M3Y99_01903300 [Aphelenchoides fujianensis]|nr:hypothetical protein M3Y99_01903300 [Aphelenchoides fujianensis]